MPTSTAISTSGNEPHGAGGRSSRGRGDACDAAWRAPSAGSPRRPRLRGGVAAFLPLLAASEEATAGPSANGQPLETLTRHQPSRRPRTPQRGRECQCLHSRSPTSSFEIRTQRCSLGLGDHALDEARGSGSSTSAPARDLGLRLADANDERVADALEVGRAQHARTADRADAPVDSAAREGGGPELAELRARAVRSGCGAGRGRRARRRFSSTSSNSCCASSCGMPSAAPSLASA